MDNNILIPKRIIKKRNNGYLKNKQRQKKFLELLPITKTLKEAKLQAGYSDKTPVKNIINNNPDIRSKAMELLDKANLDIETSTKLLSESINSGLGVKSTNSDSLRGLELVFKLHKLLDSSNNQQPTYNIQQNAYINTLNQLSDVQLQHELKKLKQKLRVT